MGFFLGKQIAKRALKLFKNTVEGTPRVHDLRQQVKMGARKQAETMKPNLKNDFKTIEGMDRRRKLGIEDTIRKLGGRNFKKGEVFRAEKELLRKAIDSVEGGRGRIKKLRKAKKRLDTTDNN
jgi:hypothetical protein